MGPGVSGDPSGRTLYRLSTGHTSQKNNSCASRCLQNQKALYTVVAIT